MATILVVDDNPINRKLLVAWLSGDGHLTVEASDGIDGLAAARAHAPQLIISDILMPSMDGYGFVRALRQDADLCAIPVIFYTANYHEREAHQLAQACGVNRVLVKPCPHHELLKTVEQVLAGVSESPPPPLPENFDREHLRLLTDKLSERAAALAASNSRFAALADLNLEIASVNDAAALFKRVCSGARHLLGSRYAVLAVAGEPGNPETFVATSGIDHGHIPATALDIHSGPLGAALRERRPWRVRSSDGSLPEDGGLGAFPAARAFLGVPLMTPLRVYGWLCLADRIGADGFDQDDEKLLLTLGTLVGRIYENIRLHAEIQRLSPCLADA